MKVELRQMAARIIRRASSGPADAALRNELKVARLSDQDSTTVATLVFTYFRWRGWLDAGENLDLQFNRAWDLEQRFAQDPASFSIDELQKAVPPWAAEEINISREWLLSLQTPPVLWLRAKHG